MKLLSLIFAISTALVATTSLAADLIGFGPSNHFESRIISGDITVTCQDPQSGYQTSYFRCNSQILDPWEYGYFNGPKNISAEKVYLTATHEDGSTREKNSNYDSTTFKSTDRINLWIRTVFQRPLLKMGKNVIDYQLQSSGQTVNQGQFVVDVVQAPNRTCRRNGFYTSNDINDCRNSNNMCDRYFYEENYCQ